MCICFSWQTKDNTWRLSKSLTPRARLHHFELSSEVKTSPGDQENYLNRDKLPTPGLPEHENELREALQDWSVFGGSDNWMERPCHSTSVRGIRRAAKNVTATKLSSGTPELCSGGTKCRARPAVPRESNRPATRQTIPETSPIQDHQRKTGHPRSSLPLHSPSILKAEHRKGRDGEMPPDAQS